jgi:hypothetical protein
MVWPFMEESLERSINQFVEILWFTALLDRNNKATLIMSDFFVSILSNVTVIYSRTFLDSSVSLAMDPFSRVLSIAGNLVPVDHLLYFPKENATV